MSLSLIAAITFLPALLTADTVVEEIVVRINNQIITRTELERSREQLRQEARQQDPANADAVVAERQKDVLRDLIDQQLLLEKGKDLGITADTEVIKKLDDMRKEMKLDSMEDLEKAATAQGVSFEDFKQNLRNQIITQQVIGKEVGSRLQINKEDEHKFYNEHKSEMEHPEDIRLSEILVATDKKSEADKTTDDERLAAAKLKADALLAEIHKGATFESTAKKSSDGPSAAEGGDLGIFKRGMLSKEIEDRTFAMKVGDISEPVRTKQGYVLLKVSAHEAAGIPKFEEVEPRLQDAIYSQKLQPSLRAYLRRLREEAFIDVKPGFVDTGASPNQTKPIETSAAQSAKAKELRKRKKKLVVI